MYIWIFLIKAYFAKYLEMDKNVDKNVKNSLVCVSNCYISSDIALLKVTNSDFSCQ